MFSVFHFITKKFYRPKWLSVFISISNVERMGKGFLQEREKKIPLDLRRRVTMTTFYHITLGFPFVIRRSLFFPSYLKGPALKIFPDISHCSGSEGPKNSRVGEGGELKGVTYVFQTINLQSKPERWENKLAIIGFRRENRRKTSFSCTVINLGPGMRRALSRLYIFFLLSEINLFYLKK